VRDALDFKNLPFYYYQSTTHGPQARVTFMVL